MAQMSMDASPLFVASMYLWNAPGNSLLFRSQFAIH